MEKCQDYAPRGSCATAGLRETALGGLPPAHSPLAAICPVPARDSAAMGPRQPQQLILSVYDDTPLGWKSFTQLAGRGAPTRGCWAPDRVRRVTIEATCRSTPLTFEGNGYHSGFVDQVEPSDLYRFRLDGGELFPDPASRFEPDGPHGASAVVDPSAFPWGDGGWRGVQIRGQVIYELHIGTFTETARFAPRSSGCPTS